MNRIILIGNGFDLAHGLPTSYGDFIDWYWNIVKIKLENCNNKVIEDKLCRFENKTNYGMWNYLQHAVIGIGNLSGRVFGKRLIEEHFSRSTFNVQPCKFFENICQSIDTKGWVDIENEYYNLLVSYYKREVFGLTHQELNIQLRHLQNLLVEYLNILSVDSIDILQKIKDIIYSPINPRDISVSGKEQIISHIEYWTNCNEHEFTYKIRKYNLERQYGTDRQDFEYNTNKNKNDWDYLYRNYESFFLPDNILMLNFNYTATANKYILNKNSVAEINHLHGELSNPESVIFGYGDELDENYQELSNLNDNEYLKNFKSIKYLESDRYRKALQFMDAAPYQVFIMGHSCGNSDRTFLNTLFEHKNCVSIKPYYYQDGNKDNYLDIVQNISRNFKDMKLMRDRVVNKTYCEPFSINVPSIRNQE
jgi:hypothetical protein